MPKKIVICCDGTGNSFENIHTDSNVAKIYSCLTIDSRQLCYYHPGLGTMGSPAAHTIVGREATRIAGLAFGAGLLPNVGHAYRYLMDTYVDGDEIFLFGFSRGAYTARALASILHVFGLLCAGNHEAIPYILSMYSKRTRSANRKRQTFEPDEAFKWQFSHTQPVHIHFCGVWDTVSSYGWVYDPVKLPFVGVNPIIDIARQAVSIDERRCFYQDNLWGDAAPGQDVRQVWFSGVHSDVGGSYDESESGLSKIAFEWMLCEGAKAGLLIDRAKAEIILGRVAASPPVRGLPPYVKPNNGDLLHHSLTGFWWLLEILPQQDIQRHGSHWTIPLGRRRRIPPHSLIHESVLTGKWRPPDLPPHKVEPWIPF